MAGILAALLPSLIGGVASLFKGKKTQYAPQQTQQQQAAYNQLLRMIQSRMGQQSAGMGAGNDALNLLYSQFLGRGYSPPQQNMGMGLPISVSPNTLRQR
jgi:hypothetical protein